MISEVPTRLDHSSQLVEIIVRNETKDALPPTKINLRYAESIRLHYLRQQIADEINPKKTEIDLMFKGSFLKGEKLSLKDLKFTKGQPNNVFVLDRAE